VCACVCVCVCVCVLGGVCVVVVVVGCKTHSSNPTVIHPRRVSRCPLWK
jgi:hypothetical protein